MRRRRLTKKQQAQICLNQMGRCAECDSKLTPDGIEFDHIKERRMAPDKKEAKKLEVLSNFQALCRPCHCRKTTKWAGIHAKAERQGGRKGQYARRKANSSNPNYNSPWDNSKWKRKFDGSVIRRNP